MIYEMYDYQDESTRPDTLPEGCEYHFDREWKPEESHPSTWFDFPRRWPAQEQRPTAYGLMTDEEQVEVLKAFHHGRLEYLTENGWIKKTAGTCLFNGSTYRIKPEPTVEIIVKVNGKPTDPCKLSKESWAALRKEN